MIAELLNEGFENRIPKEYLKEVTGLNEREFLQQVRNERMNGALILSTKKPGGGYFLPGNKGEIVEFCKSASGEAVSIFAMLKPFRMEIKRIEREES